MVNLEKKALKAILVILQESNETEQQTELRFGELTSLCNTLGLDIVFDFCIKLRNKNSSTLIGSGNLQALKEFCVNTESDVAVFDSDIGPTIQRNLEEALDIPVIDRQRVILDIFAQRARTKEAKLQVELARLQYKLPRLTNAWDNLNRQKGGVKGTRGGGEKQLELDKRVIKQRIVQLKKEIIKVGKERDLQRQSRLNNSRVNIGVVGYTNSGKSSLVNLLTKSDILEENKLFATLDTTSRKMKLGQGIEVVLSDTVGFVSNLPHNLVDSFRSTLEEANYSNILLLVVDASHPDAAGCYNTTVNVLDSLGFNTAKRIVVINKMDLIEDNSSLFIPVPDVIEISVKENKGIEKLKERIEEEVKNLMVKKTYAFPSYKEDFLYYIKQNGFIEKIIEKEEDYEIKCLIFPEAVGKLKEFEINE